MNVGTSNWVVRVASKERNTNCSMYRVLSVTNRSDVYCQLKSEGGPLLPPAPHLPRAGAADMCKLDQLNTLPTPATYHDQYVTDAEDRRILQ